MATLWPWNQNLFSGRNACLCISLSPLKDQTYLCWTLRNCCCITSNLMILPQMPYRLTVTSQSWRVQYRDRILDSFICVAVNVGVCSRLPTQGLVAFCLGACTVHDTRCRHYVLLQRAGTVNIFYYLMRVVQYSYFSSLWNWSECDVALWWLW